MLIKVGAGGGKFGLVVGGELLMQKEVVSGCDMVRLIDVPLGRCIDVFKGCDALGDELSYLFS